MLNFQGATKWGISNIWRLATIIAIIFGIFFYVRSCWQGNENQDLALKADSLQAAADTTRLVSWRANKILGDSLKAVERRVIQVPISSDKLDKALNRVSVLSTRLDAVIAELNVIRQPGTPTTVDSNNVRTSTFRVDSTPYHATARVDLPPPPLPGSIDLRIRLDTLHLRPRLQCGNPINGIRPATILVVTPPWISTQIDSSQVSPSACNPQLVKGRDWSPWWLNLISFGAGVYVGHQLAKPNNTVVVTK